MLQYSSEDCLDVCDTGTEADFGKGIKSTVLGESDSELLGLAGEKNMKIV